MVGHLTANADDVPDIMTWLNDCSAYGKAFDSAIQTNAKDFVDKVFDHVPVPVQKALIARPSVVQARAAANPEPAAESDLFVFSSSWELTDSDVEAASTQNGANLLAAANGANLVVLADSPLVIVGDGHNPFAVDYLRECAGVEEGTVTVTKGGAFDKGALDVSGISMWQGLVEERLAAVSKKPIKFH